MRSIFRGWSLVYILLALVLILCVTSCSGEGDVTTQMQTLSDTAAPIVTDAPVTEDEAPKQTTIDWDGAEIRVLCEDSPSGRDICFFDGESGTYYDAVSERNRRIAEGMNVSLAYRNTLNVFDHVSQSIGSGDGYHAVYASGAGGMSSLMLYGYLEDLNADGDVATAGVSVSALKQLTIGGKLYMLTGAPMRSSVANVSAVSYSKSALDELGYYDGYLEELVFAGAWTHDVMHRLVKENSGSTITCSEDSLYDMWQGMGAVTVKKNAGDIPAISIYDPRNLFYFEHVHEFFADASGATDAATSLFLISDLKNAKSTYGDDGAILPLPTYHEGDEYTCVLDFANTFFTAIPSGREEMRLSRDYLRALYSESIDTTYKDVIREYSFGDERMLDVVLKARHFDFLDMYGIGHIMRTAFSAEKDIADFDKLLEQRAKFAEQALDIALRQTVGENING